MDMELKGNRYIVRLTATETIAISINSTVVFDQTIGAGKVARIEFYFEETPAPTP